jgi:hypothetical protein
MTRTFSSPISRRQALTLSAKLAASVAIGILPFASCAISRTKRVREFNVLDYGAVGDGVTLDNAAIQCAIDTAAASGPGSRVLVPGGRRFLVGAIRLGSEMDFHLADDSELLASTNPGDFGNAGAMITAQDAQGLSITGSGSINGRSREFMTRYDEKEEWWIPAAFRPRLALLTGCKDLAVRDVTFNQAPSWTLHLLGCDGVQVDRVKIKNQMDVPNCDGIDPDHCRNVEISNCHIVCGDDAIVVKTSRHGENYGGSSNIAVRDCLLETQDSGVKIGTETTRDISKISFERCEIVSSCRGCTIQLRDEGNVSDVLFRGITFKARYHSAPWWGRGEAISFTAMPRKPGSVLGKISGVRVENVSGRAENSVRISGCAESRISDVAFDNVDVTFDRWTNYSGRLWDNRPTTALPGIETHDTPGIHVRYADNVSLRRCKVRWGKNRPEYFSHALEAHDVTGLVYPDFAGESAHPERLAAISVRQ